MASEDSQSLNIRDDFLITTPTLSSTVHWSSQPESFLNPRSGEMPA